MSTFYIQHNSYRDMKRILFVALLTLIIMPVKSQTVTISGIDYKITKNEATVIGASFKLEYANILSFVEYNGKKYPVTSIGKSSFVEWKCSFPFKNKTNLKYVSIPNTVKKIALSAFYECQNLTEIVWPDGNVELNAGYKDPTRKIKNWHTFYNCNSITSVRCQNGRIPTEIIKDLPEFCPFVMAYKNGTLLSDALPKQSYQESEKIDNGVESNKANEQVSVIINQETQKSKPYSDIDQDIPSFNSSNVGTFAIIIANEEYQKESKVDYALNDGKMFKTYCHQVLGLPEKNIHLVPNATLNNTIYELDWLSQVCKVYEGDASVIFYYAGHGIPNEKDGSAYLLPIDGIGRNMRTCMSTEELYKMLGTMPAKSVTVFMDACFSGAKRNGEMLTSARGVAIKAKSESPVGKNMVILSAAQGDETAYSYNEQQHGLFTYYLLKKLKATGGQVSLGELSDYIKSQVTRFSIVENGKIQTPTVNASPALGDSWKSMKLK